MSAADATVAAGYALSLVEFAVSRGAAREALLAESGVAPAELADLDDRLPLARFIALVDAAKRLAGDPALALRFGSEAEVSEASVVGLIGRSAGTLVEAFALLNRYGRLIVDVEHSGPQRFQLREDADGLWVIDTRTNPSSFPELTECTFARLAAVGRQLFPDLGALKEVHVAHPAPAHAASYGEILRAPVAFASGGNRMLADPAVLARPARMQQPRYVLSILGGHADALLARLDRRPTIRSRVEEELQRALPERRYGQDEVAQRLGLSRRTLYRRLKAEGTMWSTRCAAGSPATISPPACR